MKRFYLFLLAVALVTSTPLLTSCSDSDSENAPAQKRLNFYVMMTRSMTDAELYDGNEVSKELQALASQTLTQTLGGKAMVEVAETEVSTILDNVKQAFDKLAAETNAKRAYPGSYTFTVKCNEKEVTEVTFYTPDLWAAIKASNAITYTTLDEKGPFELDSENGPAAFYHFATELTVTRPKGYSLPTAGDESLIQEVSTVYGDPVATFTHNLAKFLKTANVATKAAYEYVGTQLLHGGEYTASVRCDYLEYTESTNLYLTENPGISISSETADDINTAFQLTLTTGYPFNVDDYKNDIVLKATILEEVDGKDKVVSEQPLTVKLVDDPTRTRVAACKTIDICKIATPSQGKYKIRIASDWKAGNKEAEFVFEPAEK
ncbi:MAG: hypothetical protein KBT39_05690 [Bacteroidales bacterium]|nr:hypothetical protein [Bacteroidales bacterium]